MKNTLKLIGLIALAALIGLAACDEDGTGGGKTPLVTPNVWIDHADYTAFTLRWDIVPEADSYTVDIDGELFHFSSSKTDYDLKNLTSDPKVYPIRVRAVASSDDLSYSNSAWSDTLNCEPAEYIFLYENDSPSGSSLFARSAGGGETAITGLTTYGGTLEKIVIPPVIGSVTVTSIGNDAFKDIGGITSISLPETIVVIGNGAFSGTNISSIVIPDSVQTIGDGAFSNIIVLIVVVFISPEPPTLGEGVFEGSTEIETIVVPEGSEGDYTTMIEDKAPDIAEQVTIQQVAKFLMSIAVTQPPKITYTVGESFNANGMTVIARYSDDSISTIQDYSILLRSASGATGGATGGATSGSEFEPANNRPLTINDTVVRLSYTEDGITRTTDIFITVSPIYTVTFNAGEGTFPVSGNSTGGNNIISLQIEEGRSVNSSQVPNPTRQGYNFNGWVSIQTVDNPASGGTTTTEILFSFNDRIYSDMNLSAKWTSSGGTGPGNPTFYTVTFNAGEGTFPVSGNPTGGNKIISLQIEEGRTVPSSQVPTPTRQGYTFNGWVSIQTVDNPASGGTTTTEVPFNFNTPITSHMDLSAKWTDSGTGPGNPTIYTVTFNAGQGSWAGTTGNTISVQVEEGRTVNSWEVPNPTWQGYNFNGWVSYYTEDKDGNTTTTEIPFNFSDSIYSNMELTAKWTTSGTGPGNPTLYTVTFDAGEGLFIISGHPDGGSKTISLQVQEGHSVNSSQVTTPIRLGHTFDSWVYYHTDDKDGNTTTTEITFNFNDRIYNNMDLTAKWTTSGGSTQYNITTNVSTWGGVTGEVGGSISTYPQGSADANTTVTIYVNANPGYQLTNIEVMSGVNTINHHPNTSNGYFFTMPAAGVTINAVFSSTGGSTQYNITTNVSTPGSPAGVEGGSISTYPSGRADANTDVRIYVYPNFGFQLASIIATSGTTTINPQQNPAEGGYTFRMPAGDVLISAVFESALKPPANIRAASGQPWNVISWDSISDASSYKVYRSTSTTGGFNLIGEAANTGWSPSYTDNTAVFGTTYFYRVSTVINGEESEQSNHIQKITGEGVVTLTLNGDYTAYKSIGPNTTAYEQQTDWYVIDVTSGTNYFIHGNLNNGMNHGSNWNILINAVDENGELLDFDRGFVGSGNTVLPIPTTYSGKAFIKIFTTVANWGGSVGSDSYRIKLSTSPLP
ncbi:MAG: InlB B-repeat-containing protein [Treponema sp.]|nr:InlB B-repeat-containing protein [Treponema sp.]